MASADERHKRVAALRSQTRNYIASMRGRRRSGPPEPEPEAAPELAPAERREPAGIVCDPQLAALAPAPVVDAPAQAPPPGPVLALEPPAAPEPSPRQALKELPLGALRLLGQGMIWRLNNLGVTTLDELAACDPQRLGESLGPIGRLVRTEIWIKAAAEILSQE